MSRRPRRLYYCFTAKFKLLINVLNELGCVVEVCWGASLPTIGAGTDGFVNTSGFVLLTCTKLDFNCVHFVKYKEFEGIRTVAMYLYKIFSFLFCFPPKYFRL